MDLHVLPLGAGQEIGRSCILLKADGKTVMLDCGIHLNLTDADRVPAFHTVLGNSESITAAVSCVLITHYHLDHCGALPHLTERLGYRGPVLMTRATQLLAELQLLDYASICHTKCVRWPLGTRSCAWPTFLPTGTHLVRPLHPCFHEVTSAA